MFVLIALALLITWFSLRYAWWRPPVSQRHPRILMYHMIAPHRPGARFNGLRVSPEDFEQQLRWLEKHGWQSFTVTELLEQADSLPDKAYAITFDDGYEDNFEQALPLLERYSCKATLYLVVDRFDRDWSTQRKAHHDEGEVKRERKLSDEQVRTMLASGRIELGSHGLTHSNFLKLDSDLVKTELQESRKQLQTLFGAAVQSFAYPFGLYTHEQAALTAEAGYSSAVTTNEGIDDPSNRSLMQLKRIKISGRDNMLAFRLRLRTGKRGWR